MFFLTYYPQAASLEWKNKENQDTGFKFLFTLFRKYYLPHLFPSFTKLTNVYKPVLGKYSLIPVWMSSTGKLYSRFHNNPFRQNSHTKFILNGNVIVRR